MGLIYRRLLCVILVALTDVVLTLLLFVHGKQWFIYKQSIFQYAFATSFIEFPLLSLLRSSILLGGVFGVLRNPQPGPNRCKASFWMVCVFACINFYYACLKLLVYSEDTSFVAGTDLYFFWAIFVWTILGSVLCCLQWRVLSSTNKLTNFQNKKTSAETNYSEKEPLLKKSTPGNYSSINETEVEGSFKVLNDNRGFEKEDSASSSTSDSQDMPSVAVKSGRKSKEKGYDELLNKVTLGTMLSYSVPDWPYITCALIFLTISSVAQIFLPLYTGKVVAGIIIESKSRSDFTKNIIIMGLISLTASLFGGLRGGTFMLVIQKLNIRVRNALFSSITSQEIGFFDNMKTGEITSRLTSDTTTMSDTIGLNCNIFVRNVIQAIGICVFMFSLSWRMSILTLMGLPLVLGVSELYGKYYKRLQKQAQDRFAVANEVAEEVCSTMQTVRSFANEKEENDRYNMKLLDVYKVLKKQCFFYAGYVWTTQTIELMLTVATLWYGGHLLLNNLFTAEHFISFILYQETLSQCFSEIGEVYTGLMQALGAAEKVFELIKREPTIRTEDGEEEPDGIEGRVSFRNVSFSYPGRPDQPVLQDVSFDINPGEVVALVGPSGGGKSSCVKLLERFYDPTSGSVLIDGRPVSSYDHKFLHRKVSLVGQEPILYARSLHDNILYGMNDSPLGRDDVMRAAKMANAHQFITELPDRYETEAGEKGTQLSGGQKQRVAIARAMVRDPTVLLLDEATSALDTESEFLVQEALERSKSDRTVLLVAHRLSTVERADRIVVIVKGSVQEMGSHSQLMDKRGTYYKLVHRQLHTAERHSKPPPCNDASTPREIASSLRHRCSKNDVLSTSSSSQSSTGSFKMNV